MIARFYFNLRRFIGLGLLRRGFFCGLEDARHRRLRPASVRREEQWQKFKGLLEVLYQHNAFYRGLCEERGVTPSKIKGFCDLPLLPIVEKAAIREVFPDLSATNSISQVHGVLDRTSGSTGNPLHFLRDRRSMVGDDLAFALARLDAGWNFGDRWLVLKAVAPVLTVRRRISRRLGFLPYHLSALEITPGTLDGLLVQLRDMKPRLITGYSSACAAFAKHLLKQRRKLKVEGIITSGETLHEDQRAIIEEAFQAKVTRMYAASECMWIGWECALQSGYHIDTERFLVEVVDPAGNPLPEGSEGEILVTSLDNECMPFVRYRIGDYGTLAPKECSCGITGPMLARLEGKLYETITTPLGKVVPVHLFGLLFRELGGEVSDFQVIQTSPTDVAILVVPRKPPIDEKVAQDLRGRVFDYVEGSMGVTVESVVEIPPNPSGKRPMIKKDFGWKRFGGNAVGGGSLGPELGGPAR